ncbi:MAG: hypothetical protein O3C21_11205 [Verrucomicrobia bacterium]|nr:hypothetical protein [Verrucomicrobiota bacterium]
MKVPENICKPYCLKNSRVYFQIGDRLFGIPLSELEASENWSYSEG